VLFRLNAQTVGFEEVLAREGISYRLRGKRFFERREVQAALRALGAVPDDAVGDDLLAAIRAEWARLLGFDPDDEPAGREARERQATLSTLLAIVTQLVRAVEGATRDAVVTALEARAERERSVDAGGVELLTLHRAKGLEWEAVFMPMLEEGSLPVSQAGDDDEALAEERRLLYVGITRARRYLALSWAGERISASGKSVSRRPSRFLTSLGLPQPAAADGSRTHPGPRERQPAGAARARLGADDAALFDALRAWRLERARADKVSPFIVAYDTVIAEIAERRPGSEQELLAIPGIGPGKVARYGQEILAIVAGDA
jgi:DNA helicase-2/ATP-dependent DNA helicase PcrA